MASGTIHGKISFNLTSTELSSVARETGLFIAVVLVPRSTSAQHNAVERARDERRHYSSVVSRHGIDPFESRTRLKYSLDRVNSSSVL